MQERDHVIEVLKMSFPCLCPESAENLEKSLAELCERKGWDFNMLREEAVALSELEERIKARNG